VCTAQGRRHHQVRKLRHELGKKKQDGGRQDNGELTVMTSMPS